MRSTIPSLRRTRESAVMRAIKMGEGHDAGLLQPNQDDPVHRPSGVCTRNGVDRLTRLLDQLTSCKDVKDGFPKWHA
jgi:hypothetical protein